MQENRVSRVPPVAYSCLFTGGGEGGLVSPSARGSSSALGTPQMIIAPHFSHSPPAGCKEVRTLSRSVASPRCLCGLEPRGENSEPLAVGTGLFWWSSTISQVRRWLQQQPVAAVVGGRPALRPAAGRGPIWLMAEVVATKAGRGDGDGVTGGGTACRLALADVEGLPRAMLDSVRRSKQHSATASWSNVHGQQTYAMYMCSLVF